MIKKIAIIFFILALIVSCKKINLLTSTYIPPPTYFPNIGSEVPEYPTPTPIPTPPEITEEIPIQIKPEIVQNGTVFGGYARRFKYKNEWYVLATNEYQYDINSKTLKPTGKEAVLKIEKDGITITKIYSIDSKDLEQKEYWKNLNSKKLIIEENKLIIPAKSKQKVECFDTYPVGLYGANFYKPPYYIFGCYDKLLIYIQNRESSDLINWLDSANEIEKENYDIIKPNDFDLSIQGIYGMDTLEFSALFYIKDKLFIVGQKSFTDDHINGFRDSQASTYTDDSNEYYTVDITKDISDNNNWVKHKIPFPQKRQQFRILYDKNKLDKIYVYGGISVNYEYKYDNENNFKYWTPNTNATYTEKDGIWSTEDGINWKEENNIDITKLDNYYYNNNKNKIDIVGGYAFEDGTPLEPSYTELNGRYYRTFKSTYPIPPIKEIMETVDKFETNFTITEEHIKKSGAYQLQVSSVPPDKAEESDWINVVPNNELSSTIGWQSGGADLFTFDKKIVRLVDYDRAFQLDNQYETAFNLSQKYYALLETAMTMEDYKKYDYYFLYYKAMADMLKIIKDKGNNYFLPNEAVTHYTFEF